MAVERLATQVLLSIAVIITLSALIAPLFSRLRQPAVVGQMVAGLALGMFPKHLTDLIFPADALPFLNVIAQVGLVLFLFTVGYELDLGVLRRQARSAMLVSLGALAIPMLLGAGLAWGLTGTRLAATANRVGHGPFVVFIAVVMSITAVPVLAWILRDRRIVGTVVGVVALASAGVMDIVGWLVLAVALALASTASGSLAELAFLLPGYLVVMLCLVRPALRRWLRPSRFAGGAVPIVMALGMASAWCTGKIGLHLIFGALFLGLITPRKPDGHPDENLMRSVEQASSALLPVFFVITGLSVNISGLRGSDWLVLAVVCVLAVAGKVGGGTLAARLTGLSNRDSLVIGVLLNTRGLTELIALNAGWQAGLIDRDLYTILVLMAVVTTVLTGPLLSALRFTVGSESPVLTTLDGSPR